MIAHFRSRQFLAFLVTGGLAALVNFAARMVLNQWMSFSHAVVLAYLIGMATAFMLARLFVFTTSRHSARRSAVLFALVNLLAIAQTWAVSMLLAQRVLPAWGISDYAPELAHAAGVAVPVFTSYLGHKYWSFAERP